MKQHNLYKAQQSKIESAYTGNQVQQFLNKFERETDYTGRVKGSYYVNFYKSIIDSLVVPVFSEKPKREYDNPVIDTFINDCTNTGTSLTEFMFNSMIEYAKQKQVFIIFDNFADVPEDTATALGDRKIPYIAMKKAYELYEYTTDEFGSITTIIFRDGSMTIDGVDEDTFIYIDDTVMIKHYTDSKDVKVIKKTEHNLGIVPVITIGDMVNPYPSSIDSADTCISIYNSLSEQRDLERTQGFAILEIPMDKPEDGIVLGSNNVIFVPTDSSRGSAYVSPDSSILKVLMENTLSTLELLKQQADMIGASSTKQESGLALGFRFVGKEFNLKMISGITTALETTIIEVLSLYFTGLDFTYTVNYISKFKPSDDVTTKTIDTLIKLYDLELSELFTTSIATDIIEVVGGYMGYDDERVTDLIKSVEVANL